MSRRALLAVFLCACHGNTTVTVGDGRTVVCEPDIGSICSGRTLVRCDQNPPTQTDCAADGKLCGSDPQNPVASACVTWSGACGLITATGVCSGEVLTRCNTRGELRIIDCGERGASCALHDAKARFECTDACRDLHVDAEGECNSGLNGIDHCVYENGEYSIGTESCPRETFCRDIGPDTGAPTCTPLCGAVGWTGRCVDEVLIHCDGALMITTDCAETGRVCAWSETDGYTCASPGIVGSRVVQGRVTYEDREVHDGLLDPPAPKPVRGAAVSLIADVEGRVLATVATNDLGEYRLRYDAADGTQLHVLVASASLDPARPVRVIRPDGLLHAARSGSFPVKADSRVDVSATERSGLAEAFNILDVYVSAQDMVRASFGLAAPQSVTAVWGIDSSTGTFTTSRGTVFLLGGLNFRGDTYDDDGYDDSVMAHEFGHIIEYGYGRTSNPGTIHSPFDKVPPVLAWSEGFADWTSSAIRQSPIYTDTNGLGGFFFDIDATVTPVNPQGSMTQEMSENTVAEILWDLSDAPSTDDDPVAGTVGSILRVEKDYFGAAPQDRGASGIDFVDFLDGYLNLGGQSICEGTRAVVGSRGFPYDFAGPTACP